MSDEVLKEYEKRIVANRQIPYTLTVEKIEKDIIWTHNQWGSSVKYQELKDGTFELVDKE